MNLESSVIRLLASLDATLVDAGASRSGLRRFASRNDDQAGFTLPEMLVVIAIVAIVGLMMVVIFTNTLRGSSRSQILSVIKQNGQAVLENMDKTIRGADDVICPTVTPPATSASSNTLVIVKDGLYTRFRLVSLSDNPSYSPPACLVTGKNGCIIQDVPTQGADITQQFLNRICNPADPMTSAQILTDTNASSGVLIYTGSQFTRNISAGFNDQVIIVFVLKPAPQAPQVIAGQIDPVTFQTSVQVR